MKSIIKLSILSIFVFGGLAVFGSSFQPVYAAPVGGNGPIPESVNIFNEGLRYISPTTAVFTWDTDRPATSRVVYGGESQKIMFSNLEHINYGYEKSTLQDNALTVKHSITIRGLTPGVQYFFRPESRIRNYANTGNEKTSGGRAISGDIVSVDCNYVKNYLRVGDNNDPEDVARLQTFLRDSEGFSSVAATGVFDQKTFNAVSQFQLRYKDDILAPWGIDFPTGYVYYTTQKKINELHCGNTIRLTESQLKEISQFKTLVKKAGENSSAPKVDIETVGKSQGGFDAGDGNESLQASVVNTDNGGTRKGFFSRLIDFFRRR